jgi:hypothetical protein
MMEKKVIVKINVKEKFVKVMEDCGLKICYFLIGAPYRK